MHGRGVLTITRELFEEVNVLLSASNEDAFVGVTKEEVQAWRENVQKDSSKFYEMCRHFKVRLDLNLLHKWSHWITPTVSITYIFLFCLDFPLTL